MFSPEGKEFTDKVLKHIKFPYDRNAVRQELEAVSYTHLDVYKRQERAGASFCVG